MVAQVVLIENPVDDIASPLGISSNMLIKVAITKISFFSIFSTIKHASNKRKVSIPMFSWSKNQIRPCLKSRGVPRERKASALPGNHLAIFG